MLSIRRGYLQRKRSKAAALGAVAVDGSLPKPEAVTHFDSRN